MYRILLPVDKNDDRGLKSAEFVTQLPINTSEIEVVVLNVMEDINGIDGDGSTVDAEKLYEDSSIPSSVASVVDYLEKEGVNVTAQRELGEPGEEILRVADDTNSDLIAMAGRKRTPIGKVLFGSISQGVLLSSEIPVVIVGQ